MKRMGEFFDQTQIFQDIARAAAAGQTDEVLRFSLGATPKKLQNQVRRLVDASADLYLEKQIIFHRDGRCIFGFALWAGTICVKLEDGDRRYRLLLVDRFGETTIFAIPAQLIRILRTLPGCDFTPDEVELLLTSADELSAPVAAEEFYIRVKHPAKEQVCNNLAGWKDIGYDERKLLELVQSDPVILQIAATACDAQIRTLKKFRSAPQGVYHYIPNPGDAQAIDWFEEVLGAMTFANEQSPFSAGPIDVVLKDPTNLLRWRGSAERVAVIRTATGSLLWPLVEEIQERDRIAKCCGQTPPLLPVTPIAISRSMLICPQAVDIALPRHPQRLTGNELDLLRAAMARTLTRVHPARLYQFWRDRRRQEFSYRENGFTVWRECLIRTVVRAFFLMDENVYRQAECLLFDTEQQQRKAEEEREAAIAKAIDLLAHPDRFAREIIPRPSSKEEADDHLNRSADAVAFEFCPIKGADAGQHFLAFSKDSLLRLLRRVSVGETLYDALIARCEKSGLLDQRNRSIKLGNETFASVTFRVEKP